MLIMSDAVMLTLRTGNISARWLALHDRLVIVLAPGDDRGGVPRSRPRRRGSARGGVPCTVPCHLCAVLGCVVHRGVEPLALPAARQKMAGFPAGPGLCTPPRRLPAQPRRPSLHEIEL